MLLFVFADVTAVRLFVTVELFNVFFSYCVSSRREVKSKTNVKLSTKKPNQRVIINVKEGKEDELLSLF